LKPQGSRYIVTAGTETLRRQETFTMNRLLIVASNALIATGLVVLPVASFAQTPATPAQTTPAAQAPAAQTPAAGQDNTAPTKAKTKTHAMNTHAKHHVAKAPAKATTTPTPTKS
jgi:hypothetical protein